MIDLSFLTEEEQEAIMKVLQRDAELKRAEEERVRHLPEKIKDDVQLKNMSGQWFYEAKSKRHRDKIHGADIIRASMRRKPATLAEVSQNKSNKAKSSWVSNVNKEVFVPPKLYGVVEHQEEEEEEEEVKSSSSSKTITSMLDKPQGQSGKAAVSPVKQRRNPFNSTSSGENPNSGESENGPVSLPQLSKKEILSPSKENQPKTNLLTNETEKPKKSSVEPTNQSQRSPVKSPVPKARKFLQKATDPVSQKEDIVPKPAKRTDRVNGISTPPRGILKRSSSSSSTDSEVLRVNQMFDAQTKSGLPTSTIFEGETEKNSAMEEAEDSSQISLEKLKQVRFSSSIGKGEPLQSPQLHHGREIGEFDLLESDEIKSSENDAIRSDSLGNKQISAVKPLGIYSSALQVNEIDHLQEDTLASSPSDTNRSVFLASETLQTKTVPSKKLETPRRPSSTVLPNNNKELIVDETRENKSNQFLSHESKSLKNSPDQHLLSAKTEARGVSNTNSAGLQQGKPDLVEERDAKTTCKPDKHAADLVKTSDESISKVLDWFKRSSGAGDRKPRYARLRGREPKEDVDFSTRTAVLTTEHSGPSMDGKTQVMEELPFGKTEKLKSVSPPACILEDTQLIKERRKPKQGEKNEKENDKSLTGFDCRRAEEKESDQEIMHQNQKSSLLEHQEYKQPSQRCESEKAIREKRRIREIRAFWEREKTIPSHGEKEAGVSINASDGSMLKGLKESDKIKPTAVYLPNVLDDQSNNMLRRTELSDESQVSRNEHQNSFEFEPGHAAEKLERTLPSDGEVHECTKPPKANNLQPRVGVTSFSPKSKYKNEKEMFQGKGVSCSQEKPNFKVLSLKEKMNEKPKNQVSNPSQFQNLRNFWDTGVKLQSSIDEGDVSLPNNTSSVTYQRESKEDKKGRGNLSKQDLIQQQTQATEREKTEKLDSAVCELPLESPTLKGLNVSQTKNTDSIQLVRKAFISKPKEKVGLPEQEAKEYIEKSIVSSKEHQNTFNSGLQKLPQVSLQLFQSPDDKDALKQEMAVDDQLCLSIETVENKTTPLDADLPKEEVVEVVDKFVLPKAGLDVFKLSLKKLEKEASEMSPGLNIKENISKGTAFYSDQYIFFERSVEQNHDISSADQKEKIRENSEKMDVPSIGKDENAKKGLGELFGEFEPFYQQHQAADKDKTLGASSDFFLSPSQKLFEKLLKEAPEASPPEPKGSDSAVPRIAEMPAGSVTYQHDAESPQEVSETIERSVAPSKSSGFSSALEKLLKEAPETSPPEPKGSDSAVPRIAEMPAGSATYQHDAESPQEVGETIERSVAPSKASGFSSALGKLLKEAAETSPPEPKGSDSAVPRIAEMPAGSATYQRDAESPQEVSETIERSVAPSKASGFSSALEKLLKEAPETSPPEPKGSDSAVPRIAEMPAGSATYQRDAESPQEVSETIERSVAPSKAVYEVFNINLQKLLKEVSEMPAPMLKNMDKKMEDKILTSQCMCAPYHQERDHPQEIKETIKKTFVSTHTDFSEVSSSLEKLPKEASEYSSPISKELHVQGKFQDPMSPSNKDTLSMTMPQPYYNALSNYHTRMKIGIKRETLEQNGKASLADRVVNEVEASDLPKRNVTLHEREKRNTAPTDVPPLERETKTITIKSFKMNEKIKTAESTSLVASENISELKAPLKFRRASTPLKDESNSPQPEAAQLWLTSRHDNEEEGDSSSLGSEFSDENSDSHLGTRSSTRSEEELNPVLMALKRSADRKMPSKSLEDIPSATSNKGKINIPKEELALSAEDVSTVPSQPDKLLSNPEKLKGLSKSVPSFLQEESDDRETDTASERSYSFGRIKKSPSSLTNLSGSSGMASLSSVSGSLMSIYSGDFGNVDVKGNIQFAIDYVEQLNELHIFICQCKDLAVADVKQQRSDPYVKTYLLPEKYKLGKRKTSVKKKTFNPVYNEILRYKIEKAVLKKQRLNISVWHNDTFGRNSFLGEVELDLGTWDWNEKTNKQINWFPLKPRASTTALEVESRAEMKLALQYVPRPVGGKKIPSTGEVHIWVKECHDLPLQKGNRINSFIKCTILPDTSRKSRQKTRTVAKTTNPVFNHTMVYDGFRPEDLKEACVELTVWDHNKLANHFLGGLRIGLGTGKSYGTTVDWMDSTSAETALWEKMMNSPNTWIEDTLPLRMLMVAKLTK